MVDDDSAIRRVSELSLTRIAKWRVVLADSGFAAIEIIHQLKPDVILLDVMMPGMDGPTTYAALRNHPNAKTVPIIFMTAKVQRQEVQSYHQLGAAGVITKPFDPLLLAGEIRAILSGQSSACIA